MANPILYQAVGFLLIAFFLVMIYFFTKTWRWHYVVVVSFVFFATLVMLAYTALVYRTLDAWRSEVAKTTPQMEKLEEDVHKLRFGEYDDTQQKVESIRLLRAKIDRVTLDRGRVWRNCTPAPLQPDGAILVTTPMAGPAVVPPAAAALDPAAAAAAPGAAAPAAPAAPPASGNQIQDQTVFYVFLEDVHPQAAEANVPPNIKLPFYYIGEFVAVASTETTVTLRPLTPLTPFEVNQLRQPTRTWALYEAMPVDGHAWFTEGPDASPNLADNTKAVFGEINEAAIKSTLLWQRFGPETFGGSATELQEATNRLNTTVEAYLRDGKSVPQANRDDYPPMEVWTKVSFLKPHKETVDSGAGVSPFSPGVTDDFFNQGRAEVAILQLGEDAQFKPGDRAILPQQEAQQLIDAGICKFEDYVYVRPLNDYVYLFRNYTQRFDSIGEDIEKIQRDIAELAQAQTNINAQLATANDEQTKLTQDLAKTQEAATKTAEYAALLETQWMRTREQLSLLYRTNVELEQQLSRVSEEMTEEINRRTIQAVAEN